MRRFIGIASFVWVAYVLAGATGFAYENASSCNGCHGSFTGGTSPQGTVFPGNDKHRMHRSSSYMDTECTLCHTVEEDDPFLGSSAGTANTPGLGCSGCHVGAGLRAHHAANGIDDCYTSGCHTPQASSAENVNPPYYGSVDTKVNNACNDVQVANMNENWSVGDFIGLDNDGDNLYDQADFDCGPPYEIVGIALEGADTRVTWKTVGGRTDVLRAATAVDGTYGNVGAAIAIPGVGLVTTNRLEVGGAAASAMRSYQVKSVP